MSIHISKGGAERRVVVSCDATGCPVQAEPPATESWRSDTDARSFAREHVVDWTHDPIRQTDYCPGHAELSAAPAAGSVRPRPTAAARDQAGNPLDRDEYTVVLRARLPAAIRPQGAARTLTAEHAAVVARLLDELAGVYRGEDLGTLAHELSVQLDSQPSGPD
ncbi:MAG: hypothetical protein ACM30G_02005 [Micromonosporaceae bacterium]